MKLIIVQGYYQTKHPLYTTYKGMLARCNNPHHKHYSYYGGRGIKVCKVWQGRLGFKHFVNDMGKRPVGFTLDRIHNDKGYSKKNCRWESMTTQSLNKRISDVNTSGYVGVHLFKATGKWAAYIDFRHKRKHLGYFDNLYDAIEARRNAEVQRSKELK